MVSLSIVILAAGRCLDEVRQLLSGGSGRLHSHIDGYAMRGLVFAGMACL